MRNGKDEGGAGVVGAVLVKVLVQGLVGARDGEAEGDGVGVEFSERRTAGRPHQRLIERERRGVDVRCSDVWLLDPWVGVEAHTNWRRCALHEGDDSTEEDDGFDVELKTLDEMRWVDHEECRVVTGQRTRCGVVVLRAVEVSLDAGEDRQGTHRIDGSR